MEPSRGPMLSEHYIGFTPLDVKQPCEEPPLIIPISQLEKLRHSDGPQYSSLSSRKRPSGVFLLTGWQGCRRELRVWGRAFLGEAATVPPTACPTLHGHVSLELGSVDLWTGCCSQAWSRPAPGSAYFEDGGNCFPIIFLITERLCSGLQLWVSNCVDPGGPGPGKGSGLGGRGDKEKGWCVHGSNLPMAISFLRWLTFQPSACRH